MLPSIESIKQQRLKINMTQKELARAVGVSTSMINQIESGRSAPSYNTAKKIFEVLERQEIEASTHNAGELCSQKIVKLKPTNTLGEAMSKMDKEKISQIPIFDDNIPVGVISDSGIISHMSVGVSKKIKIQDIMESTPPIVDNETPANTLAPLIKYSKCILVRKGTKIIGIITASDTLKMIE
ncbi:MAG: CBS domain-containing protein [Thaumarchaeota archaeon]|mgnify:FL=1|jgi:predicted transcriptional regulator|nr:CBS domain-containing protein [Nitrososphaerota archaeon]MBT3743869.1 CBS domain-containing protein [Nitrososphaerota archaeon]MBT4057894.1 CBS domain-containing protein [Nitrososphaerota archaeon]MBT4175641.1 CBS domain-containing protein [Nitrososphaerota archaeon]MBT4510387.1 CBS domain-containing protein [Nitrososphaerota archaeon]